MRGVRALDGFPVQNGYIETFNGRLRDECLNGEVFFTLDDAREKLERWRRDYNHQRPHSSLADRTPQEYVEVNAGSPFALPIVDKAAPVLGQGCATAGQKTPALDPGPDPPSKPMMGAKGYSEARLIERVN